jgi:hypothetical protein
MNGLLQTVIPAVLAALVGSRVTVTLIGRLRRTIQVNIELLDKLPADHPSREDLYEHVEELVDTLVWREQSQFDPRIWVRTWIYFWVMAAATGLMGASLMARDLAINPQPRPLSAAGLGASWALVWSLSVLWLLGLCAGGEQGTWTTTKGARTRTKRTTNRRSS